MIKIKINRVILFYLFLSFLIFTFVELESSGSVPLKVFYISNNKGFIEFGITIILFFILLFLCIKHFHIDKVMIFLLLKCVLDILPFIFGKEFNNNNFFYQYSMIVSMPIIYWIFKNYTGSIHKVVYIFSIFGLILVLQLILTIIENGYSFSDPLYKNFLRIPIAHSNLIGVILISLIVLRLRLSLSGNCNRICNLILILGLILTQSRGSWIFLLIWGTYIIVKKLIEKKKYLYLTFLIFLIIFTMFVFIFSDNLQKVILSTNLNDNFDLVSLSSGRTEIWRLAIEKWLNNPWLGTGLTVSEYNIGYEIITTGVHNIVIDYAVQSGIIGLFFYMFAVYEGLKRYNRHDKFRNGLFLSIVVILIYSMVEVCYFNYPCLFIFWMELGLYNSKSVEEL